MVKESVVTEEIWKPVFGYEDYYEVSSIGRVRAKDRVVNTRYGAVRTMNGGIRSATDNGNGYLIVSLVKDGIRKNHYVHRLVATAFIDNPNNKDVVNHKDYDKKNNNVDNLEWMSQKENTQYSSHRNRHPRNGRMIGRSAYGVGIRKRKGAYEVTVCKKYIGSFRTLEEAVERRNAYAFEHYNFIYE